MIKHNEINKNCLLTLAAVVCMEQKIYYIIRFCFVVCVLNGFGGCNMEQPRLAFRK